jgi:hypothetical protein
MAHEENNMDEDKNLETVLDQATPEEHEVVPQEEAKPIASPGNMENIKRLREEKEQLARQNEEMRRQHDDMKRLWQQYATQQQQGAQPVMNPIDEDITFNDDDLIEGKHLSKVTKKIKALESKLAAYHEQTSLSTTEARLKANYPDFDKVVNNDTVNALRMAYPDLARTIADSSDLYGKGSSAYTLIKKLGIYQDDTYLDDKIKARENTTKPRPSNALPTQHTDSALSKASQYYTLNDEEKKRAYKEMMEAIRNG